MASSIQTSKASCHVRSLSLPKTSHPLTVSVEVQLDRLRSSQSASSSSSVFHKLSSLKDLYESVDDLLQLPHTNEQLRGSADKVLDGSVRLLDVCSTTRDIVSQMKESLKELESSLRRRKIGESDLASVIEAYMVSRKRLTKEAHKCFKSLNKNGYKGTESVATIVVLRQVEELSLTVFESVLTMVCQPKSRSSWSIVSKLVKSKGVVEVDANEVTKMDTELISMKSSKNINASEVQNVLKGLEAFESSIQEAEEELECVYRQLVKTRVSVLNIINH
ncbi:hypothetical protein M5689_025331 [Euphorbia peplus]|nr:hypothetical protein M5689_025331 [Euphorbia peplus]